MSNKGYVTIPVGYKRVDGEPLELNTVFSTLELASEYATSDPTAYAGQLISVLGDVVKLYIIQEDKSLLLVGTYQLVLDITTNPMIIKHGMKHLPSVTVLDSDGKVCECQITYIGATQVQVSWNGELTGKIYLK